MRAKNSTPRVRAHITHSDFPMSGDNFTTISPINSLADLEDFISMQDIDVALKAFNKSVPIKDLGDNNES